MKQLIIGLVLLAAFLSAPAYAQDAIDLRAAHIVGSPLDIADWPATVRITRLDFSTPNGLSFERAGANWPDFTPPGWEGPIQYTVWACAPVNGWTCAGFIQMWRDRAGTGAPLPSAYRFWWGDESGGAINHPFGSFASQPGSQMAFFLSAGDARGNGAVSSVRERSNVVLVSLPANDSGSFSFDAPPVVVPPPVFVPPSAPPVVVPPSSDTDALLSLIGDLEATITAKFAALQQHEDANTERILAALPLPSAPYPQPPVVVNNGSSWLKVLTTIAAGAGAIFAGIGASK